MKKLQNNIMKFCFPKRKKQVWKIMNSQILENQVFNPATTLLIGKANRIWELAHQRTVTMENRGVGMWRTTQNTFKVLRREFSLRKWKFFRKKINTMNI